MRSFAERIADVSPVALLEESIAAYAEIEPGIEAFVHVDFEAARRAAAESAQRRRDGNPLSPIDGMPVGIKDIIETAGLPTEMGSPLFAGYRSGRDSASVAALRDAGAVIFGKTVTTEFAATEPGKTRNPWDPARTPGGSSSGSAAACGAGILPAALGTQVIGSIVRPASFCGCYGYKPSVGGINRGGSFDHLSQSVQGVLGASLADVWAVAHAIVANTGGDPGYTGIAGPQRIEPRRPQRVALLETAGWTSAEPEAKQQLADFVALLKRNGVEFADRRTSRAVEAAEGAIANALPLSQQINTWEFRWPLNTLARDRDVNGLSEAMRGRLRDAERMSVDEYRAGLAARTQARAIYHEMAAEVDVALTLSAPGEAPVGIASGTGNPIFAVPGSLLGVPALSLPLLSCHGLPLGAQVLGFTDGDAALVAAASWIVSATS